MGINIAVFVLVLLWTRDPEALTGRTSAHWRFGVGKTILAFDFPPIPVNGELVDPAARSWYRLLTAGFMHYGIIHLALNMYFIYVLGPMIEWPLGRVRFLLLYIASVFGGSLGVIVLDGNALAVGASGAAFGLLAASAVGLWRRGVNPFTTSIGSILLLNLFITFAIPGISIGGHLGGAAAGAACAAVMLSPGYKPVPKWATYAAPIAVAVLSIVLSVLVVNAA